MPRSNALFAALVVVFGLGIGSCGESRPSFGPPRIDLSEKKYDAGRVRQGERVEHTFVLRNGGQRDLRVSRVRAACDCTASGIEDPLEPGAIGEIQVSLDTTGQFGNVTRTVAVFSNDPATPVVFLKVIADVDFDVAANPESLYVGRVRRGDEVHIPGRLALARGTEVVRVESPGAVAEARLAAAQTDVGAWNELRLHIRVREQAPPGAFAEVVNIHTTSALTPILEVPVIGVVEEGT
jgi:hypothetical protein